MPHAHALAAVSGPAGPRCSRCGAGVTGTRHTRTGYTVGHFVLHGGRTVEGAVRRREDEAPLVYRRVVEPVELVSCPSCLASEEMRRRWLAWGEEESSPA